MTRVIQGMYDDITLGKTDKIRGNIQNDPEYVNSVCELNYLTPLFLSLFQGKESISRMVLAHPNTNLLWKDKCGRDLNDIWTYHSTGMGQTLRRELLLTVLPLVRPDGYSDRDLVSAKFRLDNYRKSNQHLLTKYLAPLAN